MAEPTRHCYTTIAGNFESRSYRVLGSFFEKYRMSKFSSKKFLRAARRLAEEFVRETRKMRTSVRTAWILVLKRYYCNLIYRAKIVLSSENSLKRITLFVINRELFTGRIEVTEGTRSYGTLRYRMSEVSQFHFLPILIIFPAINLSSKV